METASVSQRQEVIRSALSALKVQPPIVCSAWAEKYWSLSSETSSQPGAWKPMAYQSGMLDIATHDDIPIVIQQKSARVGFTTCNVILTAYYHIQKGRNTITYNPNDELAIEHMKARIRPAFRDVEIFNEYATGLGSSSVARSLTLNNGTIMRSLGGASTNNYRAKDADVVIFDELDGVPQNLGEGDPITLGRMRTMASPRPKLIMGTTPTISGESLLQREMESAELVLKFRIICPSCGSRESIEWGGVDANFGIRYSHGDPNSASWICPTCGGVHGFEHQYEMVESGRWESDEGIYWDSGKFRKHGKSIEIEMPRSVGMFIWSAYNHRQEWSEICQVHQVAGNDREKLQAFENTWLGLFWEDDVVSLEPDPLFRRREEYAGVPENVLCITCGIDVQIDRLEAHYIGWGPGEESWSLDYRVYYGDPTQNLVWDDLMQDIHFGIELEGEDAGSMPVVQAITDTGYATMEVYQQVRRYGHRVLFPGKGMSTTRAPLISVPKKRDKQHKIYLVNIGTINAKDVLFFRLQMEKPGPGYMHFPESEVHDFDWFRQLTSEEKVRAKRQGQWTYVYEQLPNIRNEVLDCTVYALAAYRLAQVKGKVRKRDRIVVKGGSRVKVGTVANKETKIEIRDDVQRPRTKRVKRNFLM